MRGGDFTPPALAAPPPGRGRGRGLMGGDSPSSKVSRLEAPLTPSGYWLLWCACLGVAFHGQVRPYWAVLGF